MDDLPPGFRVVQAPAPPPPAQNDDMPPGFRVVQAPAADPTGPSLLSRAQGAIGDAVQTVEGKLGMGGAPAPAPAAPAAVPSLMDRVREGYGAFQGAQAQTLRGMARGAAGLAGLPVDAMTFALNNDSDVQNILGLLGLGGKKIERPLLGSERNKEAVDTAFDAGARVRNLVTGSDAPLPSAGPQNLPERVLGRVGEEVGAMAVPVGGAISAGARMAPEAIAGLPKIARMFVEPASVDAGRFAQKEIGSAIAAGVGASGVNEATRAVGVKDDSLAHTVGDLAGAFGGIGALGVARHVGPKIADVFNALRGDPNFANRVSKDAAVDTIAEAYGLPSARLGAKEPTDTAPIIEAIQRGTRVSDTVPGFKESLADRTQNSGLSGLEFSRQAAGSPAFAERTRTNIKAVDDALQANAPQGSPGAFRGALENRRTEVLQGVSSDAAAAQARFEEASGRLQSAMHADARGADIRAPLEDAMAAAREVERGAWSNVNGSIDAAPLAERFTALGRRMTPSEQRMLGDLGGAIGTPAALAGNGEQAAATTMRNLTSLRGEFTDAQRAAASAGEPARARLIGQYVDEIDGHLAEHAHDPAAYEQARAVSRDLNDRFTRPQTAIAQTLDRQQGLPRVPDSGVPGRFVQPDNGRVSDFEALMREAGADPRARGAVRDQILSQVGRLRGPDQVDAFVRDHSRVLDQFPDLRGQIQEAAGLRRTAEAAGVRQAETVSELGTPIQPGTSSIGRYLRYGDEASTSAMHGVLNAPKPAEAMGELLNFAGNRPEAVEGAKRTFWDIMEKRARRAGETTATTDGTQPWMPAAMKRFLEEPRTAAVAERLYRDNPEHLDNVKKIAEAIQGVDTRLRARAPNSSGTAQGMSQVLSPETLQSRLYAYKRGQVSGTFLITSIAAVAGRRGVAKAQSSAIGRLVDEALTNPDAAALLLKENNPANRAKLARSAKGWIGSEAGTIVDALNDEDEDPTIRAIRRVAR